MDNETDTSSVHYGNEGNGVKRKANWGIGGQCVLDGIVVFLLKDSAHSCGVLFYVFLTFADLYFLPILMAHQVQLVQLIQQEMLKAMKQVNM